MSHESLLLFATPEDIEFRKQEMISQRAWLGGMFEVGKSAGFSLEQAGSDPFLTLYSLDKEIALYTENIFGKRPKPSEKVGPFWWAHGRHAVWIASIIEPFTPSRQEEFDAFKRWGQATNIQERREIALSVKGRSRINVAKEEYGELVNNLDFVGGGVDGGEKLRTQVLESVNRPLLEALEERFGGDIIDQRNELTPPERRKSLWKPPLSFFGLIQPYVVLTEQRVKQLQKLGLIKVGYPMV